MASKTLVKKKSTKKKLPEPVPVPVKVNYREFVAIAPGGDEPSRENSTLIKVPDNYSLFEVFNFGSDCTLKEAKECMVAYWDEWERLESEDKENEEDLTDDYITTKPLVVQDCSRDANHDGPCNRYPCHTALQGMPLPPDEPLSAWERFKQFLGA